MTSCELRSSLKLFITFTRPWGINSVVTYPCSVAVHTMRPSSTVSPKPVARSREHYGVTPSDFEVSWSLIRDTPEGLRLHSTATLDGREPHVFSPSNSLAPKSGRLRRTGPLLPYSPALCPPPALTTPDARGRPSLRARGSRARPRSRHSQRSPLLAHRVCACTLRAQRRRVARRPPRPSRRVTQRVRVAVATRRRSHNRVLSRQIHRDDNQMNPVSNCSSETNAPTPFP